MKRISVKFLASASMGRGYGPMFYIPFSRVHLRTAVRVVSLFLLGMLVNVLAIDRFFFHQRLDFFRPRPRSPRTKIIIVRLRAQSDSVR